MKVIIAGSRTLGMKLATDGKTLLQSGDTKIIQEAVNEAKFDITQVVGGRAKGIDVLGEIWADSLGIDFMPFPAKWEIGKHAGLERNIEMAKYADALIAIHDGKSRGTTHMISQMKMRHKPYYVKIADPKNYLGTG